MCPPKRKGRRPAASLRISPTINRRRFAASLDLLQLDLEDQHGIGRDLAAGAGAVADVGGHIEFEFLADGHELDAFGPAGNNLVEREGGRVATLNTAVEHGAVDERAVIGDL